MAIKKQYLKSKPICKVSFKIPKEVAASHEEAYIVGDFNNWDPKATPMKKLKKDGSFSVNLQFEKDKEYQFRYLFDDGTWANDEQADKYYPTEFHDAENSVLVI